MAEGSDDPGGSAVSDAVSMSAPEAGQMKPFGRSLPQEARTSASAAAIAVPKMRFMGSLQSLLWVPSQSGWFEVRLHPQSHTVLVAVALYSTGVNSVVLWLPSQK